MIQYFDKDQLSLYWSSAVVKCSSQQQRNKQRNHQCQHQPPLPNMCWFDCCLHDLTRLKGRKPTLACTSMPSLCTIYLHNNECIVIGINWLVLRASLPLLQLIGYLVQKPMQSNETIKRNFQDVNRWQRTLENSILFDWIPFSFVHFDAAASVLKANSFSDVNDRRPVTGLLYHPRRPSSSRFFYHYYYFGFDLIFEKTNNMGNSAAIHLLSCYINTKHDLKKNGLSLSV